MQKPLSRNGSVKDSVVHGDGINNIYDWKGSIGPLYARCPLRNIGGYHQIRGLGYYEYFTLCEDLGMEPVPVVAAGVSCQNTSHGGPLPDGTYTHGQEAIPMDNMQESSTMCCTSSHGLQPTLITHNGHASWQKPDIHNHSSSIISESATKTRLHLHSRSVS